MVQKTKTLLTTAAVQIPQVGDWGSRIPSLWRNCTRWIHFCCYPCRFLKFLIPRPCLAIRYGFHISEAGLLEHLFHHPALKMVFSGGLCIALDSSYCTDSFSTRQLTHFNLFYNHLFTDDSHIPDLSELQLYPIVCWRSWHWSLNGYFQISVPKTEVLNFTPDLCLILGSKSSWIQQSPIIWAYH